MCRPARWPPVRLLPALPGLGTPWASGAPDGGGQLLLDHPGLGPQHPDQRIAAQVGLGTAMGQPDATIACTDLSHHSVGFAVIAHQPITHSDT